MIKIDKDNDYLTEFPIVGCRYCLYGNKKDCQWGPLKQAGHGQSSNGVQKRAGHREINNTSIQT